MPKDSKLCAEFAKAFIENALTRRRISKDGTTVFGYYLDLYRSFGYERVTTRLKNELKAAFEALKFRNIQFTKWGGMTMDVDTNNTLTIVG